MYNQYPFNNFNYQQYMNQLPQQGYNEIPKVTGFEGAKAYALGANQAVALFDSNDSVFYLKTTDSAGFASYKTFRYTEVNNEVSTSNGVSREEFDSLKQTVDRLLANLKGEEK